MPLICDVIVMLNFAIYAGELSIILTKELQNLIR